MTLIYGLTTETLFARAGAVASARYPSGCASADKLADIVREVIASARDSRSKPEGPRLQARSRSDESAGPKGIAETQAGEP